MTTPIISPVATPELVDPFGRGIQYLRVSVTDRCDFRCVYCMSEHMSFLPKQDLLTLEELDRLCSAFVRRGVKKLRITGGEPLVRRDIMTCSARCRGISIPVRWRNSRSPPMARSSSDLPANSRNVA